MWVHPTSPLVVDPPGCAGELDPPCFCCKMGPKAPKNQNMQPCFGALSFFPPLQLCICPTFIFPLSFSSCCVPQLSLSLSLTHTLGTFHPPMSLTPQAVLANLNPPLKLTPSRSGEHDQGQRHGVKVGVPFQMQSRCEHYTFSQVPEGPSPK